MANISYYFSLSDMGIRKGIVEAHLELHKANKVLYSEIPYKISLYKSFKNRKNIEYFLENVIGKMETFTEIERMKKVELEYNTSTLNNVFRMYTRISIVLFGLYKIFYINDE